MLVTLRGYRVKPEFCRVSFEADFEKKTDKNLMDESILPLLILKHWSGHIKSRCYDNSCELKGYHANALALGILFYFKNWL